MQEQKSVWSKFKQQRLGVISLLFIVVLAFMAVFAYLLAPDNSENANQMHLSIHSKSPGFQVQMLSIPFEKPTSANFSHYFFGKPNTVTEVPIAGFKISKDQLEYTEYTQDGTSGLVKSIPWKSVSGLSNAQDFVEEYIQPKTFYLGTDRYGRDLLSRMLIGTRVSLSIGIVAVAISLIVGIFFGALAGYYGGKVDFFIVWLINVVWSVPTLLLVIAITLALGKGFWQVFIAVGLTMWVEVARVVRGQVMGVKEMQYVTAARALGFSDYRIIFKHILPNVTAPLIVISAANFATAILIESGLSFLGLGAQPPMATWGGIIKDHYSYIIMGKAFLAMIPGLAIMFIVLAFMLVGNALRDVLDVKSA